MGQEAKIRVLADADQAIRELQKFGKEGKKASKSLTESFKGAKMAMIGAAAGIAAAGYAVKKAIDFGREGAELELTRDRFQRLGQQMGLSAGFMDNLQTATGGVRSEMQLMTSATDLMSLGLVKNEEELRRLTTVSGELGFDMNQLVLTLSNMTTMRFDALGISVDGFKEKVKALEDAGHSAADAFRLAFLEQAEDQVEKVGSVAGTSAGDFMRLDAALDDLATTIKSGSVPAVKSLVTGLTEATNAFELLLTWNQKIDAALEEQEDRIIGLGGSYEEYVSMMLDAEIAANRLSDADRDLAETYFRTGEGARSFTSQLDKLGIASENLYGAMLISDQVLDAHEGKLRAAAAGTDVFAGAGEKAADAIELGIDALQQYSNQAIGAAAINELLRQSMEDDFISASELRNVQTIADEFGVNLPDSLTQSAENFNTLRTEGIDPSNEALFATGELLGNVGEWFGSDSVRQFKIQIEYEYEGARGGGGSGGGFGPPTGETTVTSFEQQLAAGYQHGGRLPRSGIVEVGEAGSEFIINGTVIPAPLTRQMKRLGVDAQRGFQSGGFFDAEAARDYDYERAGITFDPYRTYGGFYQPSSSGGGGGRRPRLSANYAPARQPRLSEVFTPALAQATTAAVMAAMTPISMQVEQQQQTLSRQMSEVRSENRKQIELLERIANAAEQGATDDGVGRAMTTAMQFFDG